VEREWRNHHYMCLHRAPLMRNPCLHQQHVTQKIPYVKNWIINDHSSTPLWVIAMITRPKVKLPCMQRPEKYTQKRKSLCKCEELHVNKSTCMRKRGHKHSKMPLPGKGQRWETNHKTHSSENKKNDTKLINLEPEISYSIIEEKQPSNLLVL